MNKTKTTVYWPGRDLDGEISITKINDRTFAVDDQFGIRIETLENVVSQYPQMKPKLIKNPIKPLVKHFFINGSFACCKTINREFPDVTTRNHNEVTCKSCKRTKAYKRMIEQ